MKISFSENDIRCYKVLSEEYRAYLWNNPNVQAWGFSEESAKRNLLKEIEKLEFIEE